jgi:hypothetical protein
MSVTRTFCPLCRLSANNKGQFCQKCGARLSARAPITTDMYDIESVKSGKTALVLCIFFGILGVHRFYVGKIGTGILAFLTGGCLGIWTLIDLILIIQNKFKDKNGNILILDSQASIASKLGMIIGSLVFWLIISISSFAIMAVYLTSGLVTTAEDQLTALRTGDIQKAYSYTSSEYQETISLAAFTKWVEQVPQLKNNQQISFDERGLNNYTGFLDSGFLEGTLISKDKKTIRVKYLFIKEKGVWKILGIIPKVNETNP